jgi:phytoene dehydrogenase-like protein
LHAGIDGIGLPTLHSFHMVASSNGPDLEDGRNAFISVYPGKPGLGQDRWSVSVSTHTQADTWRGLAPRAAETRRTCIEERLIDAAARVIPGFRDRLLLRRSATPRTFERYTLRPGGLVGGLVQTRGRSALRSPSHRPERGVALAGDNVFPGQGTVGVALSGIIAHRDAAEFFGRSPIL